MKQKILSCLLLICAIIEAALTTSCSNLSDSSLPPAPSAAPSSPSLTASQPLIAGVTPTEVKAGATITINGSGFGESQGTSSLTVGGATAGTIISWRDSEINAVVPDAALTGPVKTRVQDKDSDEKPLVVLWDNENPQNVIVSGNPGSPLNMQLIAEGVGGSILVWNDFRNYDPNADPLLVHIYAQRLNSRGKIIWNSGGVPLSPISGMQFFPQLVSDGHGGAIVVWQETRTNFASTYDIYAQRIGPSGALLWQSAVAICTAGHPQENPKIISDSAGGAIIVWSDYRSGSRYDVYAQRINGNGVPQWTEGGVAISNANNPFALHPEIVSDGSGGAIIVWTDYRSGSTWYPYAQRIDSAGAAKWTDNGVLISTTTAFSQWGVPSPVADGHGGAIVAWMSVRGGNGTDMYAQRIDGSGALQWGSAGTVVSAAIGDQIFPQMTTDGNGGAIITWEDCRTSSGNRDIYAQRVNASGTVQWTVDVPVCTAASAQYGPEIIPDGRGGAIITWYDYRNYNLPSNGTLQGVDTFAQRLNRDGVAQWPEDGAAISTATLHQMYPKIASDNSGGAIIIWEDSRTGSTVDIYAQGISTSGKQ